MSRLMRVQGSGGRVQGAGKGKLYPVPCTLYPAKGFTLVELMIVVVIIAAIAAMIVPRLSGRSEQARVAVAQADISSNISMALKLYELDNGNFPTTEQGLNALYTRPSSSPAPINWNGPYLETKPVDPWGNPYQYKCPGAHNTMTYDLYSLGKDGSDGTADDIRNWD
ncbi:MAG: type II secretion system major pseudopilin GspG [Candidatus Omnitrophota bacterium]